MQNLFRKNAEMIGWSFLVFMVITSMVLVTHISFNYMRSLREEARQRNLLKNVYENGKIVQKVDPRPFPFIYDAEFRPAVPINNNQKSLEQILNENVRKAIEQEYKQQLKRRYGE